MMSILYFTFMTSDLLSKFTIIFLNLSVTVLPLFHFQQRGFFCLFFHWLVDLVWFGFLAIDLFPVQVYHFARFSRVSTQILIQAESHRVFYQFYGWIHQTNRLNLSLQYNLVKSRVSVFCLPSLPFPMPFLHLEELFILQFLQPMVPKALSVPYSLPNIYSQIQTSVIVPSEGTYI